jgi:hypothetical protein
LGPVSLAFAPLIGILGQTESPPKPDPTCS